MGGNEKETKLSGSVKVLIDKIGLKAAGEGQVDEKIDGSTFADFKAAIVASKLPGIELSESKTTLSSNHCTLIANAGYGKLKVKNIELDFSNDLNGQVAYKAYRGIDGLIKFGIEKLIGGRLDEVLPANLKNPNADMVAWLNSTLGLKDESRISQVKVFFTDGGVNLQIKTIGNLKEEEKKEMRTKSSVFASGFTNLKQRQQVAAEKKILPTSERPLINIERRTNKLSKAVGVFEENGQVIIRPDKPELPSSGVARGREEEIASVRVGNNEVLISLVDDGKWVPGFREGEKVNNMPYFFRIREGIDSQAAEIESIIERVYENPENLIQALINLDEKWEKVDIGRDQREGNGLDIRIRSAKDELRLFHIGILDKTYNPNGFALGWSRHDKDVGLEVLEDMCQVATVVTNLWLESPIGAGNKAAQTVRPSKQGRKFVDVSGGNKGPTGFDPAVEEISLIGSEPVEGGHITKVEEGVPASRKEGEIPDWLQAMEASVPVEYQNEEVGKLEESGFDKILEKVKQGLQADGFGVVDLTDDELAIVAAELIGEQLPDLQVRDLGIEVNEDENLILSGEVQGYGIDEFSRVKLTLNSEDFTFIDNEGLPEKQLTEFFQVYNRGDSIEKMLRGLVNERLNLTGENRVVAPVIGIKQNDESYIKFESLDHLWSKVEQQKEGEVEGSKALLQETKPKPEEFSIPEREDILVNDRVNIGRGVIALSEKSNEEIFSYTLYAQLFNKSEFEIGKLADLLIINDGKIFGVEEGVREVIHLEDESGKPNQWVTVTLPDGRQAYYWFTNKQNKFMLVRDDVALTELKDVIERAKPYLNNGVNIWSGRSDDINSLATINELGNDMVALRLNHPGLDNISRDRPELVGEIEEARGNRFKSSFRYFSSINKVAMIQRGGRSINSDDSEANLQAGDLVILGDVPVGINILAQKFNWRKFHQELEWKFEWLDQGISMGMSAPAEESPSWQEQAEARGLEKQARVPARQEFSEREVIIDGPGYIVIDMDGNHSWVPKEEFLGTDNDKQNIEVKLDDYGNLVSRMNFNELGNGMARAYKDDLENLREMLKDRETIFRYGEEHQWLGISVDGQPDYCQWMLVEKRNNDWVMTKDAFVPVEKLVSRTSIPISVKEDGETQFMLVGHILPGDNTYDHINHLEILHPWARKLQGKFNLQKTKILPAKGEEFGGGDSFHYEDLPLDFVFQSIRDGWRFEVFRRNSATEAEMPGLPPEAEMPRDFRNSIKNFYNRLVAHPVLRDLLRDFSPTLVEASVWMGLAAPELVSQSPGTYFTLLMMTNLMDACTRMLFQSKELRNYGANKYARRRGGIAAYMLSEVSLVKFLRGRRDIRRNYHETPEARFSQGILTGLVTGIFGGATFQVGLLPHLKDNIYSQVVGRYLTPRLLNQLFLIVERHFNEIDRDNPLTREEFTVGFKLGVRTGTLGGMWMGSELMNILANWDEIMTKPIDIHQAPVMSTPTHTLTATQMATNTPVATNTPGPVAASATPSPMPTFTHAIETATQMVGQEAQNFIHLFDGIKPSDDLSGGQVHKILDNLEEIIQHPDQLSAAHVTKIEGVNRPPLYGIDINNDGIFDYVTTWNRILMQRVGTTDNFKIAGSTRDETITYDQLLGK